ncbi:MAG: SDR family NAD(P)-dependent oxidoreductase [Amphiplicatus sp.]
MQMEGTAAIVTGGGTGLGAATAIALARRGVNVCVNYATSAKGAESVVETCLKEGVDAFAVQADVSEDAPCRRLVQAAAERWDRLDILINNAGTTKFANPDNLDALTPDDFLSIYRTNVVSMYLMIRAARERLRASGKGAVVNVSSIAGVAGIGSSIAYAASKGAVNTMTLSLARAMGPEIRVNAVCPGYIASGWFARHVDKEADAASAARVAAITPLRVASTPEDIAGTLVFLASDDSRHITGECILVDAGMHLGYAPLMAR